MKAGGVLLHLRVYGRHTNVHSRVGHLSHSLGHGSGHLLHLGLRLGSGLSIRLSSHLRNSLEVASWWAGLPHMPSSSAHGSCLGLEVLHDEHKGLDKFGLLEKLVNIARAVVQLGGSVRRNQLCLWPRAYWIILVSFGLVVVDEKVGATRYIC